MDDSEDTPDTVPEEVERPVEPDTHSLLDDLIDAGFLFRVGDPIEVYLDKTHSNTPQLNELAYRNGFTIASVEPLGGVASAKATLIPKDKVRQPADIIEIQHRHDIDIEDVSNQLGINPEDISQ